MHLDARGRLISGILRKSRAIGARQELDLRLCKELR